MGGSRANPRTSSVPRLGIVIEYADSGTMPWVQGAKATVLLLDGLHLIRDVLVAVGGGGGPGRNDVDLPSPCEVAFAKDVKDALGGVKRQQPDGTMKAVPLPRLRSPDARWGDTCVIQWLLGGLPCITNVLQHPALPPAWRPTWDADGADGEQQPSPADTLAGRVQGGGGGRAADDEFKANSEWDDLGDDGLPLAFHDAMRAAAPATAPQPSLTLGIQIGQRDAAAQASGQVLADSDTPARDYWIDSYTAGWKAGATAGYSEGVARGITDAEVAAHEEETGQEESDAFYGWMLREAMDAGWNDGNPWGIEQRAKHPPPPAPARVPEASAPEYQTDAGDDEDDDNVAAQPRSLRDAAWMRGGHRIVLQKGKRMILDSRGAGGEIRIQASDAGVHITCGSATIAVKVVDGEQQINLIAGNLTLAGREARAVLGDAMVAAFNKHGHPANGAPPSEQMDPSVVLSDKVALA